MRKNRIVKFGGAIWHRAEPLRGFCGVIVNAAEARKGQERKADPSGKSGPRDDDTYWDWVVIPWRGGYARDALEKEGFFATGSDSRASWGARRYA